MTVKHGVVDMVPVQCGHRGAKPYAQSGDAAASVGLPLLEPAASCAAAAQLPLALDVSIFRPQLGSQTPVIRVRKKETHILNNRKNWVSARQRLARRLPRTRVPVRERVFFLEGRRRLRGRLRPKTTAGPGCARHVAHAASHARPAVDLVPVRLGLRQHVAC